MQKPVLDRQAKVTYLQHYCAVHDVDRAATACIGDGANDLDMLGNAGFGVAFAGKPILREKVALQLNHTDQNLSLRCQNPCNNGIEIHNSLTHMPLNFFIGNHFSPQWGKNLFEVAFEFSCQRGGIALWREKNYSTPALVRFPTRIQNGIPKEIHSHLLLSKENIHVS